jgi:hypothetical protein
MWSLPTQQSASQEITDDQQCNTAQEPSHTGVAIPPRSLNQIENGISPKSTHADRKHKSAPGTPHQLTVKYATIVGLSLEIVTACLDVPIIRLHAAPLIS